MPDCLRRAIGVRGAPPEGAKEKRGRGLPYPTSTALRGLEKVYVGKHFAKTAAFLAVVVGIMAPARAGGVLSIEESYSVVLRSQEAGRCALARGAGGEDLAAERYPGSDKTVDELVVQLHRDISRAPGPSRDQAVRADGVALACVALLASTIRR